MLGTLPVHAAWTGHLVIGRSSVRIRPPAPHHRRQRRARRRAARLRRARQPHQRRGQLSAEFAGDGGVLAAGAVAGDAERGVEERAGRAINPTNPPEASPYLYVGNNPTNYTDPTGAALTPCQLAVTGGIITIGSFALGTALLPFTLPSGGAALAGTVVLYELAAGATPLAIEGIRQSC